MSRRLLVLGGAATASLALAANAFGKTQLLVTGAMERGASATTIVQVRAETSDAAPSKVTIYLPSGYTANLGQTPGTKIGTVTASAQRLMLSPDSVAVPGTIVTDTPANYADSLCAPGLHSAVWLLHLDVHGTTVDVPVYVDRTTGTEVPFSSTKLVLCLANPYDQAVPGTRAPTGLRLVDTKLTLSAGMVTNPNLAGSFVWRARRHAVDGERRSGERAGDGRGSVDRQHPVVAVTQGKGANDSAPDDGHELRAAQRQPARGSEGRGGRQDHVLRQRQDRRLWIDRGERRLLTQVHPHAHDGAQGDGDGAGA